MIQKIYISEIGYVQGVLNSFKNSNACQTLFGSHSSIPLYRLSRLITY